MDKLTKKNKKMDETWITTKVSEKWLRRGEVVKLSLSYLGTLSVLGTLLVQARFWFQGHRKNADASCKKKYKNTHKKYVLTHWYTQR